MMYQDSPSQADIDALLRPLQERISALEQQFQPQVDVQLATASNNPLADSSTTGRRSLLKLAGVAAIASAATGATLLAQPKAAHASSVGPTAVVFLSSPVRVYDSRSYSQLGAFSTYQVNLNNTLIASSALGAFGNVTVTNTKGAGFLTLYPYGASLPITSTINYSGVGVTVANAFMVGTTLAPTSDAAFDVYCADSATDFIIDINGYIVAAS